MVDIKLIECPRDAMQGWKHFITTAKKIDYINQLLKVGFDTIDFGSFVSAKAVPQMADTREVIRKLSTENTSTKLLAIIANERGAVEACAYENINYLGFPFSISSTFQMRNTNSTIQRSFETVIKIRELCAKNKKEPVIYISMAFGNPYGDFYDETIVLEWIARLAGEGIGIISLADTVGLARPAQVSTLVSRVINAFPSIGTGVHLHSKKLLWKEKLDAALHAGCKRFDGALMGIGGCPMANDDLVGNMDSSLMISHFRELGFCKKINIEELQKSITIASEIFS